MRPTRPHALRTSCNYSSFLTRVPFPFALISSFYALPVKGNQLRSTRAIVGSTRHDEVPETRLAQAGTHARQRPQLAPLSRLPPTRLETRNRRTGEALHPSLARGGSGADGCLLPNDGISACMVPNTSALAQLIISVDSATGCCDHTTTAPAHKWDIDVGP